MSGRNSPSWSMMGQPNESPIAQEEDDEGIQLELDQSMAHFAFTSPSPAPGPTLTLSWEPRQSQPSHERHTSHGDWPPEPRVMSRPNGDTSVDAISVALSRQHLRPKDEDASTVGVDGLAAAADSTYNQGFPSPHSNTVPAGPSNLVADKDTPTGSVRDEASLLLRTAIANHNRRLRRQASSRFSSSITTQGLRTMHSHDGDASYERVHFVSFQPPPAFSPPVTGSRDFEAMQIDPPSLTVDQDLGLEPQSTEPSSERPLVAYHATEGLDPLTYNLPRYRSSAEAAARCQNLVRNRPRMRKRTKLRDKQSNSAISAAAAKSTST
ncbi:hypothetical protein BD289DRAFT_482898 [Coniella lustricola]|uniref:Uncharacterized protein n=1 Tax=Coniella lustricola TaxID=2025994 RepID=A0A2T3A787_9PEZI|nr:hypothetical protein BD289DRAFT_482898 [Coniella lustricola]